MINRTGIVSSQLLEQGYAQQLFERVIPNRGARILDIGFGNGVFLRHLQEKGYGDLAGFEGNTYGADLPEVQMKFGDLSYEKLPWQDEVFDAVCAWEVMEHLENPHFVIREIHRVLKPGGMFFLSMPNVFHFENRLHFLRRGNFWRWSEKNDHRAIFTHDLFKKSFLPYFSHVETRYLPGTLGKRGIAGRIARRAPWLDRKMPKNEWFGRFVIYILAKPALHNQ